MRNDLLSTVGIRISSLRAKHRVSRETLVEACGLADQSIKRIENYWSKNASKSINMVDLCAIADYFNVDVEYILGKQDVERRDIADTSKVTGLTYDAVNTICSWGKRHSTDSDTLSALICSPSFSMFIEYMKMFCLLEDKETFSYVDGLPHITDKEVIIAAIQHSVALMMNEARNAVHDELTAKERQIYQAYHEAFLGESTEGGK